MSSSERLNWSQVGRWQYGSFAAGAVGLALCTLGALIDPEQFFHSYLLAFLSWLGISLGSLGIWMVHYLTGGHWGFVVRRVLESSTRTLPLLALLFLPLTQGLRYIYPWVDPEVAQTLGSRVNYLNVDAFLIRAAVYFAIWLAVSFLLSYWSSQHDRTGNAALVWRSQQLSGPGLALVGLGVTFASIDWIMSIDPYWYSTIFGALVATGQLLPALALAIAIAAWVAPHSSLEEVATPPVWNDLGNLLLAFVMLWMYLSFSQFLLIWSANLKSEIPWYLARSQGGWQWIGVTLAVLYFALPFLLLLSRDVKRRPGLLLRVALLVVGMHFVHQFWLIAPSFSPGQLYLHWMDVAAPIGVGGIWLGVFFYHLQARPLLPIHHSLHPEAVAHA